MDKKLNLGTAKWLLQGAKALWADDELQEWGGLKRAELFWIISDITQKEVVDDAIKELQRLVDEGLSPTIPPELEKLVDDLEAYQEKVNKGEVASEEQIRALRARIAGAQLEEQYKAEGKGDLYVALKPDTSGVSPGSPEVKPPEEVAAPSQAVPEESFTYRARTIPRPVPAPARETPRATPQRPGFENLKVVEGVPTPDVGRRQEPTESIRQYVTQVQGQIPTSAPSSVPTSPIRPATPGYVAPPGERGEKVVFVVKKSLAQPIISRLAGAPTKFVKGVLEIGEEAIGKGPEAAQKAYAARLLNQGITSSSFREAIEQYSKGSTGEKDVVAALFKQADVLEQYERDNPYLARTVTSQFPKIYNQILIANQPAEPEKGKTVENYKAVIDLIRGQTVGVEYWEPAPGQVPPTEQQKAKLPQVPYYPGIREAKLAQKAGQAGASLLKTGFRGMGGGLGGAVRGVGSFLGALAGGGAAAGGAAAAGGTAVATAPAWVPVAIVAGVVVFLILGVGFINTTHQGAYLGEQIVIEESPFIGVSKIASKSSFQNNALPQDVTFIITVSPKQGKLTNVKVADSFSVSGTGTANLPQKSWDVAEIETPWTQDFQVTLPNSLRDNLVINYVTVHADVENQPTQTATTSLVIIVDNPPQDCPLVWPTERGTVEQGPGGTVSHTDNGRIVEAIDIYDRDASGNARKGMKVTATHRGIAKQVTERGRPNYCPASSSKWKDPGKTVVVSGMCNGKTFTSKYVHLETQSVSDGQQVSGGTQVGVLGDSGCANLPHLHYQFNGLEMKPQNIPKDVKYECVGFAACGSVKIP
ncbi:peptidoglycan DD-metalloendopeptidase family protein [Candidatus Microgenomates bacterium]|nr:peptidoglycan DD-metalloendopeptidase family protein [Candidatus Microgenomates bacterium]